MALFPIQVALHNGAILNGYVGMPKPVAAVGTESYKF